MKKRLLDILLGFIRNWIYDPLLYLIVMVILGWKIEGELPDVPKMMLAAAPHTTYMDYHLLNSVANHFNVKLNWIGKKELFEGWLGVLAYYTGGIPVDRDAPLKATKQVIRYIKEADSISLVIAPEGTRHYTGHWKKGFYFIAQKTDLPIVFFKVDYKSRIITAREAFYPTGDMEADLELIKPFFADAVGRFPEKAAPIRFADEM